jgi:hypothetical protein
MGDARTGRGIDPLRESTGTVGAVRSAWNAAAPVPCRSSAIGGRADDGSAGAGPWSWDPGSGEAGPGRAARTQHLQLAGGDCAVPVPLSP